jgi:hypothetical protein
MLGDCRVYISSEEIFSFFNDKNLRPSNFLFEIARGSGATLSECPFSSKKRTSLRRLLQENITSRLLFERTRTNLVSPSEARETKRLSSSTIKRSGLIDVGPTVFPHDMLQVRGSVLAHGPKQQGVQQCFTESE